MADASKTETPLTDDEFHTSKSGENDRLDRVAEQAAVKSSKTENRYDKDQDIFNK